MTREIKVKVTLETEETLTEDEINAIKKSLSGQTIKTVSADGKENKILGIFDSICHVEVNHPPTKTWT